MNRNGNRRVVTRRMALKATGLGALGTGLSAVAQRTRAASTDGERWPQVQQDAANTGQNPRAYGISTEAEERWRVTDDWDFWSVAFVDGTVYAGVGMGAFTHQFEGEVYAIDAADGTRDWAFTPDGRPEGTPAVSEGTVYFGTNDETVYALNAAEGTEEWRVHISGRSSQVTVSEGVVYVGSSYHADNKTLYALDATDGSKLWDFDGGGSANAAPALADDTVFVHSSPGVFGEDGSDTLHALAASDGAVKWSHQISAGGRTAPIISENTVFLGDSDGSVYAFETATGSRIWQFDAGSEIKTTPVVADTTIYVAPAGSNTVALNATTGDRRWEFETDEDPAGLAMDVDTLYLGSHDGHVYGVDAESGDQQWRFRLGGFVQSPIVVDDSLFVGSGNGNLYALTNRDAGR